MGSRKTLATAAGAIAAVVLLGVPQAWSEQYLFDMLFGKRTESHEAQRQRPPEEEPRQVVKAPKVSSPTYYNYKVDPLVKVDFSGVIAAKTGDDFAPSLDNDGFAEARDALSDLDIRAEKDVAEALAAHYAADPHFVWVTGFSINSRARQAMDMLADADSYGLPAAEYAISAPSDSFSIDDTHARMLDLMRFEMRLSAKVLRYVHDAEGGRVVPERLSGYHDLQQKDLHLKEALDALSATQDVTAFLSSKHPQNPQYEMLRRELASLRASQEDQIVVDPDMLVHPGESHDDFGKVLQLIKRNADESFTEEYGDQLAANVSATEYSKDLVPLIKAAQKAAGVGADGIIGPRTIAALGGDSRADRIQKVIIAMEEMRWLPSEFGNTYVFVNQPAFVASFIKDGQPQLTTRVVVGRPTNQTSFFYDEIEEVVYNPYWGVPRSIIVNEMLPKLLRDPGYLDRAGYEVTDSKGRHIPSASIDWGRYGANIPYDVRQTPGEANALGELKILFPNKNAIYMHDTPSKSLFQRDVRAFSHGCIRLQKPREMAAAVLQSTVDHVVSKLKQGHSTEKVPVKIPVYISYFTAWPDAEGTVHYYQDVYDRDEHTAEAMDKVAASRAAAS